MSNDGAIDLNAIIDAAIDFHSRRCAETTLTWTSWDHARLVQSAAVGDTDFIDNSDYNYDFCDSFEFRIDGRLLVSVDVSHVAPAYRVAQWYRSRARSPFLVVAETIVARLRSIMRGADYREIAPEEEAIPLAGIFLELSEPDEVTLGKSLFTDYDGPPRRVRAR